MAQYDGSIRINAKIDSKNASAQLMTLENRIAKTADKIAGLRSKMDSLKNTKIPTQEYQEIQKQIAETEKKLSLLSERREKFLATGGKESSSAFKKMNYDAEQLNKTLEYSKAELQQLIDSGKAFTLGGDTQEYANLGQQLKYAENDMELLKQRHDDLISKNNNTKHSYMNLGESVRNAFLLLGMSLKDIPIAAVKAGINGLSSLAVGFGKIVKKSMIVPIKLFGATAKKAFSSTASLMKRVLSAMTGLGKSTKGANDVLGKGFKNILKYGLGIRSFYALVNKIRSGIKEGFGNLYNESENFKNSVNSLKASALTLKNAFAGAFSPIVEIAIPYIRQFIGWITSAVEAMGQFIAAITGRKTYTKAIKQTAGAMEDTAKATKEARKEAEGYLSPLDEINKYSDGKDKGAGAGGNGGVGGGGQMFEEVPISSKFKDIAQWFKDMWKDADFTELGTLIGKKLKNALDNIPWDGIKETARKIGKSIATLINGFVEVAGLELSIGRTLSEAINTGFEFLNSFVHNLHWESIGKFIADTINGFFQNIDWNLIYDTFVTGAKGLGDAINSFVDNLDWEAISNSVSNFVNTFVDTIYTFITTVDWKKLGEKVGKTISDAWKNINWSKAGETIGEVFKAFFDFVGRAIAAVDWQAVGKSVIGFLAGIDWAGVAQSFFEFVGAALGGLAAFLGGVIAEGVNGAGEYFQEKIEECGGNIVLGILKGIGDGILGIGEWIYENIFKPFIDGFKDAFGIHSPSTVMAEMGKYLIEGLLNGIEGLAGNVKQAWDSMKQTAIQTWETVKQNLGSKWEQIKTNSKTTFSNIAGNIKTSWDNIKANVKSAADTAKNNIVTAWKTAGDNTRTSWENMKTNVVNAAKTIASNVRTKYSEIKDAVRSFASSAPSSWKRAWDSMGDKVSTVLSTIKRTVKNVFGWISDSIRNLGNSLKNLSSNASSAGRSGTSYTRFASARAAAPTPYTLYPAMATIDTSKIPGYATGQVIPARMRQHLAILGDNNRETEVVSPLSTIRQANKESLLEVLSELGVTGGRGIGNPQTIIIKQYLDGKQIAQSVIKEGKVQQMATGSNMFMLGTT